LIQRGTSDADTVDGEEGCILDDEYFRDELELEKEKESKRIEFLPLDTTKPT